MEPQIQYARTTDGVSIACYAIGSGPPLVAAQLPLSHLQLEWHNPATRRMYESVARVATWIRYDHRGFGLSDRAVNDFTLDCLAADLDAVTDRMHLDSFALISIGSTSPMAIQYAAQNPERVTHLVLLPGFTRADGVAWDQWMALAPTVTDDWDLVSEAMVRISAGWEDEESSRRNAELLRNTITPQTMQKFLRDARQWDASESVPRVTMPTLLLHVLSARYTTMENTRRLAAALPNGRLVMIDGAPSAQAAAAAAAIAQFLGGDSPSIFSSPDPERGGTAIILFTDIADSTALTERIGDAAFRALSRIIDDGVRAAIRDSGGTPVEGKVLGDGVMGVFTSAAQAIDAARQCVGLGLELPMHIGVHAGDVISEGTNIYGGAVNIASRICGLCEPGEILVSATIRELARTSAGVTFDDRGEQMLKGIDDAVRVFAGRTESG